MMVLRDADKRLQLTTTASLTELQRHGAPPLKKSFIQIKCPAHVSTVTLPLDGSLKHT